MTDNRSSTVISKEEDSLYRVKCANCHEQTVKIINRGGELLAIACSRCGTRVVRLGAAAPRSKQLGKARSGRAFPVSKK